MEVVGRDAVPTLLCAVDVGSDPDGRHPDGQRRDPKRFRNLDIGPQQRESGVLNFAVHLASP